MAQNESKTNQSDTSGLNLNLEAPCNLFHNAPVGIFISTPEGRFISANPTFAQLLGYDSPQDLIDSVTDIATQVYAYPTNRKEIARLLQKHDEVVNYECQFKKRDGSRLWVSLNVRQTRDQDNRIVNYLGFITDITEHKLSEQAIRRSENYYRTIFETSGSAILIVEQDTTISHVNSNFATMSGYSKQEIEGRKYWTEFIHPEDVEWMKKSHYLRRRDPGAASREYEFRVYDRNREMLYCYLTINLIPHTEQSVISLVDITERKRMEEKLKEMGIYDSLTGLYNRNFFDGEMERLSDGRHAPIGIIVCDLDGLKSVNDTQGHLFGDRLIVKAADILRTNLRFSDIVARIGGDEFAVLLTNVTREAIERLLGRIRSAVQDYNNTNPDLPLSISMGHSMSDNPLNLQDLFREADNRMYKEKFQG